MNYRLKFKERMIEHGLSPAEYILSDGKLHSCPLEGHSHESDDGWYILSVKKPAVGLYGSWKGNLSRRWVYKKMSSMTLEEKSECKLKLKNMRRLRNEAFKQYLSSSNTINNCKLNDKYVSESELNFNVNGIVSNDINEIVQKCLETGMTDKEIAYELMHNYGKSNKFSKLNQKRLPALKIGIAVFGKGGKYSTLKQKDALEGKVWKATKAQYDKRHKLVT